MARRPDMIGRNITAQLQIPGALHDLETSADLPRGAGPNVQLDAKSPPHTLLDPPAPALVPTRAPAPPPRPGPAPPSASG